MELPYIRSYMSLTNGSVCLQDLREHALGTGQLGTGSGDHSSPHQASNRHSRNHNFRNHNLSA